MVDLVAVSIAAGVVGVLAILHFTNGTGWEANADISQEILDTRAASVPETSFPEPMNRSIGGGGGAVPAVGEAGGQEGAELEEAEEESQSPADMPEDEVEYFDIELEKEGETIEVASNETILDKAEDEGFDLPYACRQGQCVSCAAHTPDGPAEDHVIHYEQETFTEEEMEEGYMLTCVAYPIDDFTLETNEAP
ncbi:2Fe-2S iron-sulfur cluster-binding protein [Halohasta litorea]|uniref:2Fe-2S iron-sulfur cluster-binding protein n=1 Tax=Halohasta litorea TaxID=869891 RepID=A0ABD6D5D2_9EURY|nr:2Fe-2S iron-sulfur cluster binding domain-containing protein [Halohasta litorea]